MFERFKKDEEKKYIEEGKGRKRINGEEPGIGKKKSDYVGHKIRKY